MVQHQRHVRAGAGKTQCHGQLPGLKHHVKWPPGGPNRPDIAPEQARLRHIIGGFVQDTAKADNLQRLTFGQPRIEPFSGFRPTGCNLPDQFGL